MSDYNFIASMRRGIATKIAAIDGDTGRPQFQLSLRFNDNANRQANLNLSMFGPGDVTGLERRHIRRMEPPPGSRDFEPNYLPFLEFDRAEMPWLLTPELGNTPRPWICLLVLPKSDAINLTEEGNAPNPVLDIAALPDDYTLPDLTDRRWWAHVEVNGSWNGSTAQLLDILQEEPHRVRSRLLSPIKLAPQTSYIACLVPTYRGGVQAGLGHEVDEANALQPAWSPQTSSLRLPVYHYWEFATGLAGDFESLVRRLQPRTLPPGTGGKPMQVDPRQLGVSNPPDDLDPWPTRIEGALRDPNTEPPEDPPAQIADGLADVVVLRNDPQTGDPVISPPVYGHLHAGKAGLPAPGQRPPWLRELNIDPRHRVGSAMGTHVIQQEQEALMFSAWQQAEDLEAVNRTLRLAQAAREINGRMFGRLRDRLDANTFTWITRPLHARQALGNRQDRHTVHAAIARTQMPPGSTSLGFRRLMHQLRRKRGNADIGETFERLRDGRLDPAPPPTGQDWENPSIFGPTGEVVQIRHPEQIPQLFGQIVTQILAVKKGDAEAKILLEALKKKMALFIRLYVPALQSKEPLPLLDTVNLRQQTLPGLDPENTMQAYISTRVTLPRNLIDPEDPIEPILAAPEFPQPMYRSLHQQFPDMILPGLGQIPKDTITLLETNPHFVESFMVGLNHEINRELMWREFPTDMRGTPFRQFWDISGNIPAPVNEAQRRALEDIPHIHTWRSTSHLGTHMRGVGPQGQMVLLVRGDLLRRYPDTLLYAVPARWQDAEDPGLGRVRRPTAFASEREELDNIELPVFKGELDDDVSFFGFNLTTEQVRGEIHPNGDPVEDHANAGYFFIFQQPPGRTRFGLDVNSAPNLTDWNDLGWDHVAITDSNWLRSDYALGVPDNRLPAWGDNAADMAEILRQKPFRIAIHADDMILYQG